MLRFLKRLTFFSFPLLIYFLVIIIADPFEYFQVVRVISGRDKLQTFWRDPELSMQGVMMWKLAEYKHFRTPNIILGDSRAFKIQSDTLKAITGEDYYNFATPGGDPNVYIQLFWDINRTVRLKNVYITFSFHNFGHSGHRGLYQNARRNLDMVYPFFTNPLFVRQALTVLRIGIRKGKPALWECPSSGLQIPLGKEPLAHRSRNFESEWKASARAQEQMFRYFRYPDDYYHRLLEIADYCREKNINLVFIIPPNYRDVRDMALKAGLGPEIDRFRKEIRSLAETYDFDYDNELTNRKELYSDVWHFSPYVYTAFYREVWRKEPGIAMHTYPEKKL